MRLMQKTIVYYCVKGHRDTYKTANIKLDLGLQTLTTEAIIGLMLTSSTECAIVTVLG